MREIKFRAWEKNLKEIIPVHNIDFEKKMINTESAWRTFEEIELLQYTGLRDINGVEIYEGDILELIKNHDRCWVQFWEGKFVVTTVFKGKRTARSDYDSNDLGLVTFGEVIGNIYENAELLGKSK